MAPSSSRWQKYHETQDVAVGSASFLARLAFSFEVTAFCQPFLGAFFLRLVMAREQLVEEELHVQSTL